MKLQSRSSPEKTSTTSSRMRQLTGWDNVYKVFFLMHQLFIVPYATILKVWRSYNFFPLQNNWLNPNECYLFQLFNKLMTQDKENKSVAGSVLFSTLLANALDSDSIESYLGCNRGCFLLVISELIITITAVNQYQNTCFTKKMKPAVNLLK
jgi:hypothetical protein